MRRRLRLALILSFASLGLPVWASEAAADVVNAGPETPAIEPVDAPEAEPSEDLLKEDAYQSFSVYLSALDAGSVDQLLPMVFHGMEPAVQPQIRKMLTSLIMQRSGSHFVNAAVGIQLHGDFGVAIYRGCRKEDNQPMLMVAWLVRDPAVTVGSGWRQFLLHDHDDEAFWTQQRLADYAWLNRWLGKRLLALGVA